MTESRFASRCRCGRKRRKPNGLGLMFSSQPMDQISAAALSMSETESRSLMFGEELLTAQPHWSWPATGHWQHCWATLKTRHTHSGKKECSHHRHKYKTIKRLPRSSFLTKLSDICVKVSKSRCPAGTQTSHHKTQGFALSRLDHLLEPQSPFLVARELATRDRRF